MKAGSSYAIVFGKKLQTFACEALGVEIIPVFAPPKEVSHEGQGLTAVEKFSTPMHVATHWAKYCILALMYVSKSTLLVHKTQQV